MVFVPRHVRKVLEQGNPASENPRHALQELRNEAAWVLLGEPGAGKSRALEEEATAAQGIWISIAKFLSADPDPEWQGKTLFLDGLDETRASGGDSSVLLRVRARLVMLGKPPFRIACRAADWFGSTDRQAISDASPNGQLAVLLLEPLDRPEILEILRENHGIADPEDFVEKAEKHGLEGLLSNPQSLQLLAESIRDGEWPSTRLETYQRACEQLADEHSKQHRNRQRAQAIALTQILEAAGQLCAVLLLSDKSGLALDAGSADGRFPLIDDFSPPDLAAARQAAGRKLFRQSPEGEERIIPSHRSIAEYLAAHWLARQLDCRGLPLGRVLNLLLGADGRTVAGLRGLYGWLALHSKKARPPLIEADPLTVVVYGDVKPMSPTDKRHILAGLRLEAERHTAFRWEVRMEAPFGALADPELAADFVAALESPERTEAAQSFADCVLAILAEGEPLPGLGAALRNIVVDDTRWGRVRTGALQTWLKQGASAEEARALLTAITDGQLTDSDDELSGQLLRHLYPVAIEPEDLLRYLHAPKDQTLIGSYAWFWGHRLSEDAPAPHVSVLLDHLAARTDLPWSDLREFHLKRMVGSLLARGIELHGESVSNERLFAWLGIGADEYGDIHREKEEGDRIADWLQSHPERYKALLALCYMQCESAENPKTCIYEQAHRLHGAVAPEDIGLWHLEQASLTANDALAENHLFEAVRALTYQRGHQGLNLEKIEAWGDAHPERKQWLEPMLAWGIQEWRTTRAVKAKTARQQRDDRRRERSIRLSKHIPDIRTGRANAVLMHELADVWLDHYPDTHGETPLERFNSYCDDGPTVLGAAEAGFRLCPERDDLPTVAEIINTNIQKEEHFIRNPCLIGMELRWRDGAENIEALPEGSLRRMIVFRLTYGAGAPAAWLAHLVAHAPHLVAEVLVDYASATLVARQEHVEGIYPLAHDPAYGAVARAAVPELLKRFPLRCKAGQLSQLEYLLKAALLYTLDRLPALLEKKIAAKSMDVAQKVYWLTAAMLFDPQRYEAALWKYVGKSWNRANYLSGFLSERFGSQKGDYELSARTLGKLIELLMPHAELDWPRGGGLVNEAMRRGDHIRAMVTRLGSLATSEAAQEIERLLALPATSKLKFPLEDSRHQLRLKQRENAFRFPPLSRVARILVNREPANAADLAALTLDHLDDIAQEIRRGNGDLFRQFWTEGVKNVPKSENSCRDALLDKLRARLTPFGIDCQPEVDHFNDKRADIRLSWRNEIALPIEIKGEWNESLWTALRSQLIGQYAIDPRADGYGIYLVLWFGGELQKAARDGGKKPRSPDELKARLQGQLDPEEQRRIFVRMLDVSWPSKLQPDRR